MTFPPHPLVGIAMVAGLLAVAVALAAVMRSLGWVSGEIARKSVHVQLGLIVASFPWLFTDLLPVWCLAGIAVGALAAVRWVPPLRATVGGSLHDVDRMSWGEFCFPIAAAAAWTLMPGDWIRFSLPILVLAVADAVAALVGKRYGHLTYSTSGEKKSWEGSLAFAGSTFLVVYIPLLVATPIGKVDALLIAVNMAMLLMLVEALAWEGFDNLFIPIAGLLLIDECYGLPLPYLAQSSVVMLGLTLGVWWWRKHTTLDDAAVLTCAVIGFVLYAAGGWLWMLAPAVLFVVYTSLYPPSNEQRDQRAFIPLSIILPGLVWLLVDTRDPGNPRWVMAAAGTYAVHLACIGMLTEAPRRPERSWWQLLLVTWLVSLLLILLPTAVLIGQQAMLPFVSQVIGVFIGVMCLWFMLPDRKSLPTHQRRWLWQCIVALAGSCGILLT